MNCQGSGVRRRLGRGTVDMPAAVASAVMTPGVE